MIQFELLGEPVSKKNCYRISSHGGFYKPSKITDWEDDCYKQIRKLKLPRLAGKYNVSYLFIIRRDKDLDNMIVSVNDVLQNAGVIDNDKNIMEYRSCSKVISKVKPPKVMIVINII